MKNLWILTEERPKKEVVTTIIKKFAEDRNMENPFLAHLRILPILENNRFTFRYRVAGVSCQGVNQIFLEIISGTSSFVDFWSSIKMSALQISISQFMLLRKQKQVIQILAIQEFIRGERSLFL